MITITLTEKAYGQLAVALNLKRAELFDEAADCDNLGMRGIGDFYRERATVLDEAMKEFDGRIVNPAPQPETRYVYLDKDGKPFSWDDLGGFDDIPF